MICLDRSSSSTISSIWQPEHTCGTCNNLSAPEACNTANHILRPRGRDSALRQWGLHLASRGGKQARNKAMVAVARKLAVLLHRIWTTQEPYMPFHAAA